ncbi:hypothetical protein EB796_001766 [Bugula neritina]|uniref:Uncharacterized protein n=1 Tax=Bugula neritina TaxID=10212 RepID=A0A7J7KP11_BUGNE|nr:hypothetical protein EB796_001766 [Bugula neritina]
MNYSDSDSDLSLNESDLEIELDTSLHSKSPVTQPVRESLVNGDIPNSLHCNYSLPVGRGVHPESHDMASPRQPSEPDSGEVQLANDPVEICSQGSNLEKDFLPPPPYDSINSESRPVPPQSTPTLTTDPAEAQRPQAAVAGHAQRSRQTLCQSAFWRTAGVQVKDKQPPSERTERRSNRHRSSTSSKSSSSSSTSSLNSNQPNALLSASSTNSSKSPNSGSEFSGRVNSEGSVEYNVNLDPKRSSTHTSTGLGGNRIIINNNINISQGQGQVPVIHTHRKPSSKHSKIQIPARGSKRRITIEDIEILSRSAG